jgi:hypothetical protein
MWDKDDHLARSVQFVCGLALIVFLFIFSYLIEHGFGSGYGSYGTTAELATWGGAAYLAVRCLWYAITGKDNINRDDFD